MRVILVAGVICTMIKGTAMAEGGNWPAGIAPAQYAGGWWNYPRYPDHGRYPDYYRDYELYGRKGLYLQRQPYPTYTYAWRYDHYPRVSGFRRYGASGLSLYAAVRPYPWRLRLVSVPYRYRNGYRSYRPYGPGWQPPEQ